MLMLLLVIQQVGKRFESQTLTIYGPYTPLPIVDSVNYLNNKEIGIMTKKQNQSN